MKKNYIAPEVALVNYAAENMILSLSLEIGSGGDGETAGSNVLDIEEGWED